MQGKCSRLAGEFRYFNITAYICALTKSLFPLKTVNRLFLSLLALAVVPAALRAAQAGPPDSLYVSYCTRQALDSVYLDCSREAGQEKTPCLQAMTDYLMAEWAYDNSLRGLSEYYIQKAIASASRDDALMADCLSRACILEQRKGNLAGAIDYAERCLEIDRQAGIPDNISSSLSNIAGLYLTSGQADVARKYIDEALEIERSLQRDAPLANRLGMASEIYLKLSLAEESLAFASESCRMDSLAGREAKYAIRLCQKASALSELSRDSEAERDLNSAIPLLRRFNNVNSLSIAYAQLGEICVRAGREREADEAFRECVSLASSYGNNYIEGRGRKGLWLLHRDKAPSVALVHLERYNEIQACIASDRAVSELTRFNVRYETLKKEQIISMQHQKLKWGGICLGLMLILLVSSASALLFYRRSSKLSEEKNAILVKKALETDRLLMLSRQNMEKELKEEIESLHYELPPVKLTSRELQIARLTCDGLLSKEIADRLGISQRTVETHKNNLYHKLGINNMAELVSYMHKAGLSK